MLVKENMAKDIFLDPIEVKKQKEAEDKFKRDKKLKISDLRQVLSTPEGRRTIWRIIEDAKVMAEGFSLNALEMAKWQGERYIGIRLLSDVEISKPGVFYQMFCEAKAKSNESSKKEEETNGHTDS